MASDNIAYGYKRPNIGDRLTWWADWLFNFDRLSTHKHDGTDSAKISTAALSRPTDLITAANWGTGTNGYFKQTIACPAGVSFPQAVPVFYVEGGTSNGHLIHPSIKQLSETTYEVTVNDSSLNLRVVYA